MARVLIPHLPQDAMKITVNASLVAATCAKPTGCWQVLFLALNIV